jgi:hypothetical protein
VSNLKIKPLSPAEMAAMTAYVRATPVGDEITLAGFGDFLAQSDRKIVTSHDYPPIPSRNYDWSARYDNYDGGDPIGYGRTEAEAIADLQEQGA